MSEENVEVLRNLYAAAARRDSAAVMALYHENVHWDASRTTRGVMAGTEAKGRDALHAWFREWYEVWQTVDDDIEELIDAGGDQVVSVMVQRGRGRVSGAEVENRLAAIWTIREGKVAEVVWFPHREQAMEAAGLA
jgi:ketosteroid isomerase-like protein